MAITEGSVFVIDPKTNDVLYQAHSVPQATGFADAHEGASVIAIAAVKNAPEFMYQIALIDNTTGQVVAHGPTVDLFEAPDLICDLRIVILPVTDNRVKAGCDHVAQ